MSDIAEYRLLTERITDGFAYWQLICGESQSPTDALLLYANPALATFLLNLG